MLAVVLLNLAQKEARLELQQSSTSAGVVYDWVPPPAVLWHFLI